MKVMLFSVLDIKSQTFLPPIGFNHKGLALRWFEDLSRDEKSFIHKHPEDYRLFQVGDYDDQSGYLTSLGLPDFLISAIDFFPKSKPVHVEV